MIFCLYINAFKSGLIRFSKALQKKQPSLLNYMSKQHNKNKSNMRLQTVSIHSKLNQFQQTIRKNHIQSLMSTMRDELLGADNQYNNKLKNMNLEECFKDLKNIRNIEEQFKKLETITFNLVAYCVAMRSDHMYSQMDNSTFQHLIAILGWENIGAYEVNPQVYLKIHWIIGNYCHYACWAPITYFKVMLQLLENILQNQDFYEQSAKCLFFTHFEAKQIINLIFYGLSSVQIRSNEVLHFFIGNQCGFVKTTIKETRKLQRYLQECKIEQNDKARSIIYFTLKIFENFLSLPLSQQYQDESESKNHPLEFIPQRSSLALIESLDIQIVNTLLEILGSSKDHNSLLQEQIAECMIAYFLNNLESKPEILLGHKFQIVMECFKKSAYKLKSIYAQDFNQAKRSQSESEINVALLNIQKMISNEEQILSKWLQCLVHVFAVNFEDENKLQPEKNQLKSGYEQLLIDWIKNYIVPAFTQILMIDQMKSKQIISNLMNILQNVCSDEPICEIILDQYTFSKLIFSNFRSQHTNYWLKKQSLICLVIMLQVAYGDGLKRKLMEKDTQLDFAAIFAENLGTQLQLQFNQTILQGLNIMLQFYSCQQNSYNPFWRRFCYSGGKLRLLQLVNKEGKQWIDIIKFAQLLLNTYDNEEA